MAEDAAEKSGIAIDIAQSAAEEAGIAAEKADIADKKSGIAIDIAKKALTASTEASALASMSHLAAVALLRRQVSADKSDIEKLTEIDADKRKNKSSKEKSLALAQKNLDLAQDDFNYANIESDLATAKLNLMVATQKNANDPNIQTLAEVVSAAQFKLDSARASPKKEYADNASEVDS